jgi:hypothetical protein
LGKGIMDRNIQIGKAKRPKLEWENNFKMDMNSVRHGDIK